MRSCLRKLSGQCLVISSGSLAAEEHRQCDEDNRSFGSELSARVDNERALLAPYSPAQTRDQHADNQEDARDAVAIALVLRRQRHGEHGDDRDHGHSAVIDEQSPQFKGDGFSSRASTPPTVACSRDGRRGSRQRERSEPVAATGSEGSDRFPTSGSRCPTARRRCRTR